MIQKYGIRIKLLRKIKQTATVQTLRICLLLLLIILLAFLNLWMNYFLLLYKMLFQMLKQMIRIQHEFVIVNQVNNGKKHDMKSQNNNIDNSGFNKGSGSMPTLVSSKHARCWWRGVNGSCAQATQNRFW